MVRELRRISADQGVSLGQCKPFTARPVPQTGKAIPASDKWAAEQFEELQRVLAEYSRKIAALESLVGDGSWDG